MKDDVNHQKYMCVYKKSNPVFKKEPKQKEEVSFFSPAFEGERGLFE